MTAQLRRAGRGRDGAGTAVWSVADGARGRRWRSERLVDGRLVHALLLETGLDGQFTRLEIATSAGLLTLHPASADTVHGNVVTPGGMRHLALPWSLEHRLEIDDPVTTAATLASLDREGDRPTLAIELPSFHLAEREFTWRRDDDRTWVRIDRAAPDVHVVLPWRADGLPVLEDAEEWALEE